MTDDERDEILIRVDERLDGLHKEVMGNGQPGHKQRIESLEGSRNIGRGMVAVLTSLVGLAEWFFHRGK
jgi:hypothetical protein